MQCICYVNYFEEKIDKKSNLFRFYKINEYTTAAIILIIPYYFTYLCKSNNIEFFKFQSIIMALLIKKKTSSFPAFFLRRRTLQLPSKKLEN